MESESPSSSSPCSSHPLFSTDLGSLGAQRAAQTKTRLGKAKRGPQASWLKGSSRMLMVAITTSWLLSGESKALSH